MFSGLIEATAKVLQIMQEPGGIRLVVARPAQFTDIALGDSIALQGCCLTVVALEERSMSFQAGEETLSRTGFGELKPGDLLNCERSLKLGDRLGGHLVSGHVDGRGQVIERSNTAEWTNLVIEAPAHLMRQMVSKGSITMEGVSLTVVDVTPHTFSVALIPHTLTHTTLGDLQVGAGVNLETDLLAKYVQRQLEPHV
jgi:riboflavin synthase